MERVKIGVSMLFCLGKPFSSLIQHLRSINVKYVELIDDGLHALNSRRVKILKEIADLQGFKYTVHAPFADINIASPNPTLRNTILKRLENSMNYARQLNCQLWVFHPGLKTGISYFYPGQDWRINLDSVKKLLKTSRNYGVEIAIENVPEPHSFLVRNVNEFSRFYHELKEQLGMALDIGHANINKEIQDFLHKFSDKIVHMHASDNNGKRDAHQGIGKGTINWRKVAETIEKIGYNGIIIVESVEHVEKSVKTLRQLFS